MMEEASAVLLVLSLGGLGLAYGLYYIISVFSINPKEILKDEEEGVLLNTKKEEARTDTLNKTQIQNLKNESNKILSGANSFLLKEISYSALIIAIITVIVYHVADKPNTFYRAIAFVCGAILNFLSCYITVIIASGSNYRIAYKSFFGLGEAYNIVFKASLVISFCVVSLCLLSIICLILIYKSLLITPFSKINDYNDFFESIFAFGLGASVVSLISRISGGYYSKSADIAGDIIAKKLNKEKMEDNSNNPLSIFDKIGDILGGIAGVATDSFGTLSLGICAALYMASTSEELVNTGGYYYPLLIIASGIFVCILSTSIALLFGVSFLNSKRSLFKIIILQMFFSIFLIIPFFFCISINFLPDKYNVGRSGSITYREGIEQSDTMMCPLLGLMSGLCISIISFYYTSDKNPHVSQLIESNKQGSTIGIILGLSSGYISSLFPTIIIAGSLFYSYYLLDIFGITLCSLGMLSILPVYISIDASGTIADNSSGLCILCGISEIPANNLKKIERTCNTFGKGYFMSCSSFVALSLLGVYVIVSKLDDININTPLIFAGLLFGAMKPYYLSSVILIELGKASIILIKAIKKPSESTSTDSPNINNSEQLTKNLNEILLKNSVKKIFYPTAIVVLLPIKIGLLLGVKAIAGMILGIILSGIQLGISSYISGIAWKSSKSSIDEKGVRVTLYEKKQIELSQLQKKFEKNKENPNPTITQDDILSKQNEINDIEKNKYHFERKARIYVKDQDDKFFKKCLKSSVIGDLIGDALKDLSGPFLMIIIKLIPVICIISSHYFLKKSLLIEN